jgi:aminoglycoside phosphotransferase family enzyme
MEPTWQLSLPRLVALHDAQRRALDRHAALFDARVAQRHVVEGHGDLRPEHVCLLDPPVIIDCLEFSAELRLLDAAAEIAFLALECERLGHPRIATRVLELYRLHCHDDVDRTLLAFYRASRAFVRAKVAAWHLYDELPANTAAHWHEQAEWYLNAAANGLHVSGIPAERRRGA